MAIAMTAHRQSLGTSRTIQRVGVIGYGFVGRAAAHAMGGCANVAFHDPAVSGSQNLTKLAAWSDAVMVAVPTPRAADGTADLGIVFSVIAQLFELGSPALVILKSTVPPGTCEHLNRAWPTLALVANPEFLRERYSIQDAVLPSRTVIGWTPTVDLAAKASLRDFYTRVFPDAPVVEMDACEAELLKYASNALFGVKVSFANEMHELAQCLGVDWERVRRALVLDPRAGDGHLSVPGSDGQPGFGGNCLPKDISALLSLASNLGAKLPVVSAAFEANLRRRRD